MYVFLLFLFFKNLIVYFFKFEYKFNKLKLNYGNFEYLFFNIKYLEFCFLKVICRINLFYIYRFFFY